MKSTSTRRVVVTGIGAVTPFGVGVPLFAEALRAGRSGIQTLTQLDTSLLRTKGGGEVPLFSHGAQLRSVHFASLAFQEAWNQANLQGRVDPTRLGVLLGTSRGAIREWELAHTLREKRNPTASGFLFPNGEVPELSALFSQLIPCFGSSPLGHSLAKLSGAAGPIGTISAACTSGTIAIGEAVQWIREGRCDAVITGGAEAPFTPTSFAGVCSSKAMSERWDDPSTACRPFDRTRDGYVMGEGAGVLILEAQEHARARNAPILAEILGYAQTADADHITVPTGIGLSEAISLALRESGVAPSDLDYINAHGTSTELNDRFETLAVKKALGPHADLVPLSSTKSMTGHLLGAAGAVEAIATILAMQGSFLPPTINYHVPDPNCDLDTVPNFAREARVDLAMSQSLGFGGHNAVLVMSGVL
ncbi:beta-ketoacyl-[acyl-carrier-protein] synthase family protein [Tumebacillus sp. ITR2]|uniref:Beta-ketoacyl-[acyl-carrier-protein] synthase family protein n=1 Tax=Tumebacillus amylolyticus TaxID=2801339 RepID=A0ABS1J5G3_9BACL|nr:beta-ketoacyl-[acyl-carrier-protein] synthase family protein [Tumebacillus amylolyticus]MBL0385510.1 beta-ketoacyl-[acyl-carrier-protein] synthase family protein [Tumebacillus amylolyticus]